MNVLYSRLSRLCCHVKLSFDKMPILMIQAPSYSTYICPGICFWIYMCVYIDIYLYIYIYIYIRYIYLRAYMYKATVSQEGKQVHAHEHSHRLHMRTRKRCKVQRSDVVVEIDLCW